MKTKNLLPIVFVAFVAIFTSCKQNVMNESAANKLQRLIYQKCPGVNTTRPNTKALNQLDTLVDQLYRIVNDESQMDSAIIAQWYGCEMSKIISSFNTKTMRKNQVKYAVDKLDMIDSKWFCMNVREESSKVLWLNKWFNKGSSDDTANESLDFMQIYVNILVNGKCSEATIVLPDLYNKCYHPSLKIHLIDENGRVSETPELNFSYISDDKWSASTTSDEICDGMFSHDKMIVEITDDKGNVKKCEIKLNSLNEEYERQQGGKYMTNIMAKRMRGIMSVINTLKAQWDKPNEDASVERSFDSIETIGRESLDKLTNLMVEEKYSEAVAFCYKERANIIAVLKYNLPEYLFLKDVLFYAFDRIYTKNEALEKKAGMLNYNKSMCEMTTLTKYEQGFLYIPQHYDDLITELSGYYLNLGLYDKAIEAIDDALVIYEACYGKESLQYALRLCDKALLYYYDSDIQNALKYYKEANYYLNICLEEAANNGGKEEQTIRGRIERNNSFIEAMDVNSLQ